MCIIETTRAEWTENSSIFAVIRIYEQKSTLQRSPERTSRPCRVYLGNSRAGKWKHRSQGNEKMVEVCEERRRISRDVGRMRKDNELNGIVKRSVPESPRLLRILLHCLRAYFFSCLSLKTFESSFSFSSQILRFLQEKFHRFDRS